MSEYIDWSTMRRPGLEGKRINIDLPSDFLKALDNQATRRGITRQSLIKTWLYERLDGETRLTDRSKPATVSDIIEKLHKAGYRFRRVRSRRPKLPERKRQKAA
jgi:hypothetical protein